MSLRSHRSYAATRAEINESANRDYLRPSAYSGTCGFTLTKTRFGVGAAIHRASRHRMIGPLRPSLLALLALLPASSGLTLDSNVGEDEYKGQNVGQVIVRPAVNSIGKAAFEDADVESLTIRYSATTLSFGEASFKAADIGVVRRLCKEAGCLTDCYRQYTLGQDAF